MMNSKMMASGGMMKSKMGASGGMKKKATLLEVLLTWQPHKVKL